MAKLCADGIASSGRKSHKLRAGMVASVRDTAFCMMGATGTACFDGREKDVPVEE